LCAGLEPAREQPNSRPLLAAVRVGEDVERPSRACDRGGCVALERREPGLTDEKHSEVARLRLASDELGGESKVIAHLLDVSLSSFDAGGEEVAASELHRIVGGFEERDGAADVVERLEMAPVDVRGAGKRPVQTDPVLRTDVAADALQRRPHDGGGASGIAGVAERVAEQGREPNLNGGVVGRGGLHVLEALLEERDGPFRCAERCV